MGTDVRVDTVVGWLLEGDPAIRWQVLRDLSRESKATWMAEQRRVATEGWGARLLGHMGPDGRWTPRLYGKKWISTTYSMVLLRRLGLPRNDPRVRRSCELFVEEALWYDGGLNISASLRHSETCVTGMVLGVMAWFEFDHPARDGMVDYLLAEQLDDGGWNCQRHAGAVHGSLHTTTSVLEGLYEHRHGVGDPTGGFAAAERRGREFLAAHGLYRSHRTGEVIDPRMTRLSFPPRWRHDILRALDHFREAEAPVDARLEDPIDVLERKRRADGTWPLQQRHQGKTWFEMEKVGEPSRWNTLRALRVLDWWRRGRPEGG